LPDQVKSADKQPHPSGAALLEGRFDHCGDAGMAAADENNQPVGGLEDKRLLVRLSRNGSG